jgi:PAS domain S-box-containing protein
MLKRFFRDLRIRYRLLISYASIFILATLLGGAFIYVQVKKTIESSIENELHNTTRTVLNMVETAANVSIKNHLRAVAEMNREIVAMIYGDFQAGRTTEAEAKDLARQVLFSQVIGKTGYIYCASSKGVAIEHPKIGVAGHSFLSHNFVQDQITRREGYLEYEWKNPGELEKRPKALFMTYFEPWDWIISVSTYREEFRELINISDFEDRILSLSFGKTGYAFVFDTQGNSIVHPSLDGNYFDAAAGDGHLFVRDIIRQKNGKIVYSWKNPDEEIHRDKLVIFNHLPEYDWIVASSCYLDELYAPLKTVRNIILVTILGTILVILPTSLWISASIIRPLQGLMDRFAKGGAGDFTVRMPVSTKDEIGQLSRYFNNFMDKLDKYGASLKNEIHSHKKTGEALRESEEKYRTILKRIEEGYFEIDEDGLFLFCNDSMKRMLGINPEDGIDGKNIYDYTDRRNQVKILMALGRIRNSGNTCRMADWELTKIDGSKGNFEASVSPIADKAGNLSGFRGVMRDVTERLRSEKALRMSEEMFSKAFRCSPSGIFIASFDDFRLINVNDAFLDFTGRSLLEVIGKNILSLNFFRDKAEGRRMLESLHRTGKIKNREIEFLKVSGEVRLGVISAETLELWGERCLFVVFEDQTETKRLEREIIDISERERQKIGMDLHDDLCPQLIGIEVLSKILKNKMTARGLPEACEMDRIRNLIMESIGKTRRLSRGLCPVNLYDHGLDSSLRELAAYVEEIYKIRCRCRCELSAPFQDDQVATHIYYIAHEAVHNAAKHSGADAIDICFMADSGRIFLSVTDNGEGIPEHPEKPGMGLKIMKYRASRINGFFDVQQNPSGGTIVTLELNLSHPKGVHI